MNPRACLNTAKLPLFASAALLAACSHLLTYSPSDKYDNRIVRGEVTYIFTQEDMEKNWRKMVAELPDAPPLDIYLSNYQRVVVTVQRGLGSGVFLYPFNERGALISVGAVVDVPVYVGGPLMGKFAGRPKISAVVCSATDLVCLASENGRLRGAVGDVIPR